MSEDKDSNDSINNKKDEGSSSSTAPSSSNRNTTDIDVETLRRYLAETLGFLGSEEKVTEKIKVLDDVTLEGVVDYIQKNNCKNIITMAGAGISTAAGIPDFRSPGSGLYHNLEKYKLPHPQAIFELSFFLENPKPFFVLAKELFPGSFKPTKSHYFIKLLEEKDLLLRHYTQNIDTLERVAGISDEKLVEAHGTFHVGHCLSCNNEYSLEWMKERIFKDEIPTCEKCTSYVKPDIVFFGENLPSKFHKSIQVDFKKCDVLLILGSSLVVQPFASLLDRVPENVPRLLINREKAGERNAIMSMIGMGNGLDFSSKNNTRDAYWLGDCDDGCQLFADQLGWGEELKELVEKEHKRFEAEEKLKEKVEKPLEETC